MLQLTTEERIFIVKKYIETKSFALFRDSSNQHLIVNLRVINLSKTMLKNITI